VADLPRLDPRHLAELKASGISDDVIAERGYFTVRTRATAQTLGFSKSQAGVIGHDAAALAIPIKGVRGDVRVYQMKPNRPRVVDGRILKYETAARSPMVVDVHPFLTRRPPQTHPDYAPAAPIYGPKIPLLITEGVKKADSAVSVGLCCVDLLGVWNWRGSNGAGGTAALPDWEMIPLKGWNIPICSDSDVTTKSAVHAALVRLKAFLESRGALVRVIYLPSGPSGAKVGLDDYIVARRAGGLGDQQVRDALVALGTDQLRAPPHAESDGKSHTSARQT
jgi:hypothetical protein